LKCERNKIEELQEISNSKRKCESEKWMKINWKRKECMEIWIQKIELVSRDEYKWRTIRYIFMKSWMNEIWNWNGFILSEKWMNNVMEDNLVVQRSDIWKYKWNTGR
jgi:hypothetical protein